MHTHTDIHFMVDASLVTEVSDWLNSMIDDVAVEMEGGTVSVLATYSIFEIDQITDLIKDFFVKFGDVDLKVVGFIDSSESAGEYQDFYGEFVKGHGVLKYSDWYVYFYPEDYEDMNDDELKEELSSDFFYQVNFDEAKRVIAEYKENPDMERKIILHFGKYGGKLFDDAPLDHEWMI